VAKPLPDGTLTLLFTNIEGSTALLQSIRGIKAQLTEPPLSGPPPPAAALPTDGRLLDHSATVSACDNMPQCEQ